jgi:EmrB/QacA subfamily drug resistance transporter
VAACSLPLERPCCSARTRPRSEHEPVIGGFLTTKLDWRWIFYVNVPMGIVAFAFGYYLLREHKEPTAGRFDVPGFVLSGAGLAAILYALSQGVSKGWGSGTVLGFGLGGVGAYVALVVVELRVAEPLLDLRLFGNRLFRSANIASFMSSASLLGLIFLLPLFLQGLRGLSALESGLATFPQAFGVILMSSVVGRLYPRIGPRRLLAFGLFGIAMVSLLFLCVDLTTSLWWVRAIMFGRGLFFAFAIIPLQAASFATVRPEDTGRASALFSAIRQIGAAVGVATLATLLASRTKALVNAAQQIPGDAGQAVENARVTGFHDAFFAASTLALVGMAFALLIRDKDAESTMQPTGGVAVAAH